MYMAADSRHAVRTAPKPAADSGKALGEGLYQEGANRIDNNWNESFHAEHGPMMSLSGLSVKTGKCGYPAFWGEVATFSCLFKIVVSRYGAKAMKHNRTITIKDLYPHMSEAELAVAEANFKRYVVVIVRIHDRLKSESKSWPDSAANLTVSEMHRTIPGERSNSPKKAQLKPIEHT